MGKLTFQMAFKITISVYHISGTKHRNIIQFQHAVCKQLSFSVAATQVDACHCHQIQTTVISKNKESTNYITFIYLLTLFNRTG